MSPTEKIALSKLYEKSKHLMVAVSPFKEQIGNTWADREICFPQKTDPQSIGEKREREREGNKRRHFVHFRTFPGPEKPPTHGDSSARVICVAARVGLPFSSL